MVTWANDLACLHPWFLLCSVRLIFALPTSQGCLEQVRCNIQEFCWILVFTPLRTEWSWLLLLVNSISVKACCWIHVLVTRSVTEIFLVPPASPSSPEHLPATPAESPAQRFEARIEDGKLYYDKRWYVMENHRLFIKSLQRTPWKEGWGSISLFPSMAPA